MSTSAISSISRPDTRSDVHPVIRQRKLAASVLTAIAVVLAGLFIAVFGSFGLFVMAVSLPVPLLFLWAGSDVLRSDEARS